MTATTGKTAATGPAGPAGPTGSTAADWFLSTEERGNPFTRLAHRRGGAAWSGGNSATLHVHGAEYFARLRELVEAQRAGDLLLFTDWRGDPDEQLGEDGLTILEMLTSAARRGVLVRGLFWRSHLDALHYSEKENRTIAEGVRAAGGQVILDQRVLPLGSHHQKFVVLRHPGAPERDAAFVGGIDLCHTRRDDAEHRGDPQTVGMGAIWGKTPAWHDLMVEVRGPAVGDVEATFRERWEDPTPPTLEPVSRFLSPLHRGDAAPDSLPPQLPDPDPSARQESGRADSLDVQILRTFPRRRPRYPFAPDGERSVARAYDKAVRRAHRMIYLEDQYVWSREVVDCFAAALRAQPELLLVIVLSTYTTADTALANASGMGSRAEALELLHDAGGDRVGVYGIENHEGTPVYVHSKLSVVDDVWMTVGSDNINLRSWTYDSELTCAILDPEADGREPRALRHDGDPARRFPREARLELAREHLDRAAGDDADLVDPAGMFAAFRESAARLDAWYAGGKAGPRPAGRLRTYSLPELVRRDRMTGRLLQRLASDPDGRPRALRGTARF